MMNPATCGRVLYGGVLFYTAVENLRDLEGRIQYAESKGVPFAEKLVPVASGLLLVGSVGITLWRAPRLSAAAVATFLLGVTPTMHDFWNMEGQQRAGEKSQFAKNISMFGAALMLLARANVETDDADDVDD